jgi:hypothetical protein
MSSKNAWKKEVEIEKKRKTLNSMRNLYEAVKGREEIFEFSDTNEEDALRAINETVWALEDELGRYAYRSIKDTRGGGIK